jgi:aminopeptidase YwaD
MIDEADLRRHVGALASTPRVPGTPQHVRAREYILSQLVSSGLKVNLQDNSDDDSVNVIGECGDSKGHLFVVGAHYDSVPESPGADDNASGVAALIELAGVFGRGAGQGTRFQFVAFDREEDGLLGSRAYVRKLPRSMTTNFLGMLSLEMLGYTADEQAVPPGVVLDREKGDFLAVVANGRSAPLLRGFRSMRQAELVTVDRGTVAANLARLSDHGSFWDAGLPALLLTDTAMLRNPHYHQRSDTPESLDYAFLKKSAEMTQTAITRLVSGA